MTDSQVPAGWHADPFGRFTHRYWDGSRWTEHVADNGVQSTDPPEYSSTTSASPAIAASGEDALARRDEPRGFLARKLDERTQKREGQAAFDELAMRAARGDSAALAQLPSALSDASQNYRPAKLEAKRWELLAVCVRQIISDDVLSDDEEAHLVKLSDALATPLMELAQRDFPLFEEFAIARINSGDVPELPASSVSIMLKSGEVCHGSFGVSLMKEVSIRQFRAGTQSVSIPLGGGVRYRVGGMRGRSVVVGTEMVTEDTGMLYVTSKRAVFTGQKKTLEFRFDRLVGLEQYTDGLRMSVSNRQAASLFKFGPRQSSTIAGAMISTAAAGQQ